MEEVRRDPLEVKIERVTADYIQLVKADKNMIGLIGHQPRLQKIRKAYKSGYLTDEHLEQVVVVLVKKYYEYYPTSDGYQEPYNNIKEFFEVLKPGLVPSPKKQDLTKEQSRDIIRALLEKHDPKAAKKAAKKFKAKMKRKASTPKIDATALPAHLRSLA